MSVPSAAAKKTAAEPAYELSELIGPDFIITASRSENGWIVDRSANSTLIAPILACYIGLTLIFIDAVQISRRLYK